MVFRLRKDKMQDEKIVFGLWFMVFRLRKDKMQDEKKK